MFHSAGAYMGGIHGFWWIFWLVLIGVVVLYALGRSGLLRRAGLESPHDVLQRRLASGEINADDYEQRKALLDRDAKQRT